MERAVSAEERIRRAEEIYARRKSANMGTSIPYARVNVGEKRKARPIRKMLIQILVCVVIYVIFYAVNSGEFVFSREFSDNIKNILEYDISFQSISDNIVSYINQVQNKDANIPEENRQTQDEEISSPEVYEEGLTEGVSESLETDTLGVTEEVLYTEESSSISQMEIDAEYIKQNYSFIKPLNGTITSRFGNRNPTVETVPKYHTGIDIAANIGTKIIAAMDGEVTLVSSSGDYR